MAFRQSQLQQKTTNFAKLTIKFCKSIPASPLAKPIISQLIRSATSIGVNYTEANNASSKKDFRHKIFIAKKEATETRYWLTLIQELTPHNHLHQLSTLQQTSQELVKIFQVP